MGQDDKNFGGFKAQGRTADDAMSTIEDARAVCEAGVCPSGRSRSPPDVKKIIAEELPISVYSIRAGDYVGGGIGEIHGNKRRIRDFHQPPNRSGAPGKIVSFF
jgi:3-methyl-2-oxobutanoate hydroxymethyltransferase